MNEDDKVEEMLTTIRDTMKDFTLESTLSSQNDVGLEKEVAKWITQSIVNEIDEEILKDIYAMAEKIESDKEQFETVMDEMSEI